MSADVTDQSANLAASSLTLTSVTCGGEER